MIARVRGILSHKLAKNTAALMLLQISAYAAPMLVLPYLSRVLSKEHFGLIAFSTSFNWYFITLVEYGFNLTATRRVAIAADDPRKVSQIFSSVMMAKALLTLLGFIILLSVVLVTPALRPDLSLYCISYLAVVGDLLFPVWLFQGLQKMENLVVRDICSRLCSMALMFAFVHRDSDYLWAAGFQAGSMVVGGLVGLATVPFVTAVRFVPPSRHEIFTALREGWPVFLSMAALTLSSSTNTFILGLRSGPVPVALYTAAYRLIVATRMLVSPVVSAIYPHISHMAFKSRENAIQFLRKYTLLLAAPFFLGSLVLLAGAPWIIRLLYGPNYGDAVPLLRILAFSPFLLTLSHCFSTFYMLAFGYEKEWSRIIFQGTVLNFLVLIPLLYLLPGEMAVAITGTVLDIFSAGAAYLFYRRSTTATLDMVAV